MILFASVGTRLERFDRFVEALDHALEQTGLAVTGTCQTGSCLRQSQYLANRPHISRAEFSSLVMAADVVICHAGVGAIRAAVAAGHVPLVMPRRHVHSEVLNDHQLDVVAELEARGLVRRFDDAAGLAALLTSWTGRRAPERAPIDVPAGLRDSLQRLSSRPSLGGACTAVLRAIAFLGPALDQLRLHADATKAHSRDP